MSYRHKERRMKEVHLLYKKQTGLTVPEYSAHFGEADYVEWLEEQYEVLQNTIAELLGTHAGGLKTIFYHEENKEEEL